MYLLLNTLNNNNLTGLHLFLLWFAYMLIFIYLSKDGTARGTFSVPLGFLRFPYCSTWTLYLLDYLDYFLLDLLANTTTSLQWLWINDWSSCPSQKGNTMWEETLARSSSAECQYLKEATSIYCYLMLGITTGNITMHNITYKKYTYERTQI